MNILIIGAGDMGLHYHSVLTALKCTITVVGSGEKTAAHFQAETGHQPLLGGIEAHIGTLSADNFTGVIVASPEHLIGKHTILLLEHGFKKILVEKPGGFDLDDIAQVNAASNAHNAEVFVGYNRRFFASTLMAKSLIEEDGGALSFRFEFSEWGHVISSLEKAEGVKDEWFLNNSTHLIDLSYFLCGWPVEMQSLAGQDCDWHKYGSNFTGSGITETGARFSYYANWSSPGSFGLEINTNKSRLLFSPVETLQQKLIGNRQYSDVDVDYEYDQRFNPGIYKMVEAFLNAPKTDGLIKIQEQNHNAQLYHAMRTGQSNGT